MRALVSLATRELINPARVTPYGYPVALALAYFCIAWLALCVLPAGMH